MSSKPHEQLHERVERVTQGGDLRLIYGIGVPLLATVGFIAAFALNPTWWLLIPLVALLIVMTAIVVVGFNQMMRDDDSDDR